MRRLLPLVLLAVAVLGVVLVRGDVPCDAVQAQPACQIALKPGPTEDAMRLVEVSDHTAFSSSGELRLTTVAVEEELDLAGWVRAMLDDRVETVARETLFPSDVDREDVTRQNAALMADSQLTAAVAALERLGHEFDEDFDGARVAEVLEEAATDELEPDDVIVAVDGEPTLDSEAVVRAIGRLEPDEEAVLTVRRTGEEREVAVRLGGAPDDPSRAFLGVLLQSHLELPVDLTIDAGVIGGPSAGLIFALSIMDMLESEELTGGAVVAGTGTVDRDGRVGAVGGVRQKVVGAAETAGGSRPATVFLVPEGNLEEARGAAPDREVLLVPVATLDDAVAALADLRGGTRPQGALAVGAG